MVVLHLWLQKVMVEGGAMKINPTRRVGKDLAMLIDQESKKLKIPKTKTSNLLARFAREKGFPSLLSIEKKNKKGTVLDVLATIVPLFMFAVSIIVGFTLLNNFVDTGALNQTTQSAHIIESARDNYTVFDNLFLAAFVGLSLSSIISAAFVRTSPLFFAISLVLLIIILFVCAGITNIFGAAMSQGSFSAASSSFPIMFFIMDNLLLYGVVEGALILLALFSVRGAQV